MLSNSVFSSSFSSFLSHFVFYCPIFQGFYCSILFCDRYPLRWQLFNMSCDLLYMFRVSVREIRHVSTICCSLYRGSSISEFFRDHTCSYSQWPPLAFTDCAATLFFTVTAAGGHWMGESPSIDMCHHRLNTCAANHWGRRRLAPTHESLISAKWIDSSSNLARRNGPDAPVGVL